VPDPRTQLQVLHTNERTKAWSTVVSNLGTALAIAGFGTLWLVRGFDAWGIIWIVFGFAIIAFGIHLLAYLELDG
jgi:heme/copper-type cytochrome/quinol oxidase subunit 4